MSYLEIDGNRHAIPAGESVIGSDASSFLTVEGSGIAPQHVVIVATADGQASARRVNEESQIFINGVLLGPQPAPLLHGDKIEVGGRAITFVDERRSGSTTFVSVEDLARLRPPEAKPAAKRKATAGTGGRLVSLTDGREYTIGGGSLVIGREASCDVVVTQKRISRRHAEIVATPKGYVVIDLSSNGTFVNGERITEQRLLARADVIRLGDDEFRFYADKADEPEPEPATPSAPRPAPGAEFRLGDTLHGMPSTAPVAAPTPPTPPTPPAPPAPEPVAPPAPAPSPAPVPVPAPEQSAAGVPPQAAAPPQPPAATAPAAPPHPVTPEPTAAPAVPTGVEPEGTPPPPASRPAQSSAAPPVPPPPVVQPAGPAAPAGAASGTLANLIVRSGDLRGQRFAINFPVVNVGRAEYNDIIVPDLSVSSAHAKIQLREGIWILVDLDATNGSFVDGERVDGEAPLAPGAMIRFGEVSVVFEPTKDDSAEVGGGTQVLGSIKIPPRQEA